MTLEKDSWTTKGCYAYTDGNGYDGKIYFSTGGTHEDNQNNPGSPKYRPEPCVPSTEKACEVAGKQMNKKFSASTYSTKGCYFYPNDEYPGMYYGTGGVPKATIPNDSAKERPVIYTDGTITTENDCI